MALSIQTNVNSLIAQENLRANSNFQAQTVQRLTSGFRINQSGDDAAGLAIANKFRSDVAELTQGVRNANDGVSQLQIIDGGLGNISKMLDRMKTLATQSASTTFTGDRATLNNEYQALVGEIDRQAANIGLNANGTYNSNINVYIGGGGSTQSNSQISIDLSGAANQVDSHGLGVKSTSLLGTGAAFNSGAANNTVNLNTVTGGVLLADSTSTTGQTQVFTVNLAGGTSFTASISSSDAGGITVDAALQQLNSQLSDHGLAATIDTRTTGSTAGQLMISGSSAFTVTAGAAALTGSDLVGTAGTGLATTNSGARNGAMYGLNQTDSTARNRPVTSFAGVAAGDVETLTFTSGGQSMTVGLNDTNAGSAASAVSYLNTALGSLGISAVVGSQGDIEFQGTASFSVSKAAIVGGDGTDGTGAGVFAVTNGAGNTAINATSAAPSQTGGANTANALTSLSAVSDAVSQLGLVQGRVGTGQNKLNYAINLAQSQISNFSAAESRIRDTDIAAEAANLTKASVLSQASMAAMAQANSAPQQVLSLLRG